MLVLDGAAVRVGAVAPAGLAEAAERFAAAGAELGAARSRRQCRIAQDTAVEGLHHVRTARRSLGLDPGPRVPGQGVGGTLRSVLADGSWSMPRLVDAVLVDARGRPGSCPLVPPAGPLDSAVSNSNGRASRQFGADRHGDQCSLTRPACSRKRSGELGSH